MTWSRNGNKTGSISIVVNTQAESPYFELDYKCNDKPIKYQVQLVSTPSNLGKGIVWFFICPRSGKRCRKLHLADTYFYHRSAFRGCMYEKQTYSHNNRTLYKKWDQLFSTDKVYEQLYSKHFKKFYAGKPTKQYLKLMRKIQAAEGVSEKDLMALILK